MTLAAHDAPDAAQRGLLLAAHRAFRTHIDLRCGQLKGECTAAGAQLAANSDSISSRNKVHIALQQLADLKAGLETFGPPSTVPESDFREYIGRQRATLLAAYRDVLQELNRATLPLLLTEPGSQEHLYFSMALARAAGRELARKELLDRFDTTFAIAEGQLPGI